MSVKKHIFYYLYFIIIISPVFISLNFSNGLRFDNGPMHYLGIPSIPISAFVVTFIFFRYFKMVLVQKTFIMYTLCMLIYTAMNYLNGTERSLFVFLGMLLPLISYFIHSRLFQTMDMYNDFYFALITVFYIKLFCDIFMYSSIITSKFCIDFIEIYNYYDYFPFFYYLIIVLSLYNLANNKFLAVSFCSLILGILCMYDTDSRTFQYSTFLIPLFIFLYKSLPLKLGLFFLSFFCITVFSTLFLGLSDIVVFQEPSMYDRVLLWKMYFEAFNFYNIAFPFLNDFRVLYANNISLHNEFLDQFSYFGLLVFIYYFYFIKNIFINIIPQFKMHSFLIMFAIIIGGLIQSNLSNPYIAVLFGIVFAMFRNKQIALSQIKN